MPRWGTYSNRYALIALLLGTGASAALAGSSSAASVERRLAMMGTTLTITVEAVDRPTALAASERAVRALEAAEARLSTWRDDTELARFNRSEPGKPVALSPRLSAELAAARRWWQETEGAFDPGIGALVEAWGLRRGGCIPTPELQRSAMACGGLAAFRLEGMTATRLHPGLRIEEGGFGKGAALDEALAVLAGEGVFRAMLDLGGQVAVMGSGDPVVLGVADPRRRDRAVLSASIDRGSVATSGNSEHGFDIDGRRYGHILDPRTGKPAPDFGSLTVWAPDAMSADCLSTGLYVLGPDGALAWASRHSGIEVLVLEPIPGGLRARATPGLKGRITRIDEEVVLEFWKE